jgi:hypothetical protein
MRQARRPLTIEYCLGIGIAEASNHLVLSVMHTR